MGDDDLRPGRGADAVLQFKVARDIVNRSYQTKADNIVGKMTIAALDARSVTSRHRPGRPRRRPAVATPRPTVVVSSPRPRAGSHSSGCGRCRRAAPAPWRRPATSACAQITAANALVRSVTAPSVPARQPVFFKPAGVIDEAGFDPKPPFQMVPVAGFRTLGVRTGELPTVLRVEADGRPLTLANVRATPPIPVNPNLHNLESVAIPPNTIVHFQVLGFSAGEGLLVLRSQAGIALAALSVSA